MELQMQSRIAEEKNRIAAIDKELTDLETRRRTLLALRKGHEAMIEQLSLQIRSVYESGPGAHPLIPGDGSGNVLHGLAAADAASAAAIVFALESPAAGNPLLSSNPLLMRNQTTSSTPGSLLGSGFGVGLDHKKRSASSSMPNYGMQQQPSHHLHQPSQQQVSTPPPQKKVKQAKGVPPTDGATEHLPICAHSSCQDAKRLYRLVYKTPEWKRSFPCARCDAWMPPAGQALNVFIAACYLANGESVNHFFLAQPSASEISDLDEYAKSINDDLKTNDCMKELMPEVVDRMILRAEYISETHVRLFPYKGQPLEMELPTEPTSQFNLYSLTAVQRLMNIGICKRCSAQDAQ